MRTGWEYFFLRNSRNINIIDFRSILVCSILCDKSDDCSAFYYQNDSQTCELGLKGKAILKTLPSQSSITVHMKPGM